MMQTNATLVGVIWPTSVGQSEWVRRTVLVIAGTLLLTLSAKLKIPLVAVPITMQTFVVLVLGMAYGRRLAGVTVLLYLAAGASGLPVFAGTPEQGIGIVYLFGPTGGYLLGFALAATVCGWLAERGWDKPLLAWGLMPFLLGDLLKLILAALVMPTCWRLVRNRGKGGEG